MSWRSSPVRWPLRTRVPIELADRRRARSVRKDHALIANAAIATPAGNVIRDLCASRSGDLLVPGLHLLDRTNERQLDSCRSIGGP